MSEAQWIRFGWWMFAVGMSGGLLAGFVVGDALGWYGYLSPVSSTVADLLR